MCLAKNSISQVFLKGGVVKGHDCSLLGCELKAWVALPTSLFIRAQVVCVFCGSYSSFSCPKHSVVLKVEQLPWDLTGTRRKKKKVGWQHRGSPAPWGPVCPSQTICYGRRRNHCLVQPPPVDFLLLPAECTAGKYEGWPQSSLVLWLRLLTSSERLMPLQLKTVSLPCLWKLLFALLPWKW